MKKVGKMQTAAIKIKFDAGLVYGGGKRTAKEIQSQSKTRTQSLGHSTVPSTRNSQNTRGVMTS